MYKKIFSAICCMTVMSLSSCASAQNAEKTAQRLIINGDNVNLPVYSISDSNYFKVRDVAYYMDFGVEYDADTNTVDISTDKKYGGDAPAAAEVQSGEAEKTAQTVFIDGKEAVGIGIYNINGSNYFKIRDLADRVDFGCRYNKAENCIELCKDFGYNSADVFGRAKNPDTLKMTAIDVGQGDSILIEFPNNEGEMLIDAGTSDSKEHIEDYLSEELPDGRLEYLVATHPHADHIGSMRAVIEDFDVDTFYNSTSAHTTKTYTNMLAAAEKKGILKDFNIGEEIKVSDDVSFTFLGPVKSDYEDLNDTSTVIRLKYKNTSFLFTGDAEALAESDILNAGYDVSADVVKVGHHGSYTSSSQAFVDAVGAKYAVASLAYENDYNHPSADVIRRWQASGAEFLATSVLSDIVITSDGENIKAYPDTDYALTE